MEKCHLTYSYIFTPRVPHLLKDWGLDLVRAPDTKGMQVHDLWLSSVPGPFCSRFLEVIDERDLILDAPHDEFPLKPGFSSNLPEVPLKLSPRFTLEGFILEENSLPKDDPLLAKMPAPVFFENRETSLMRQLSYKKASPYWALVIHPLDPTSLHDSPEPALKTMWRNQQTQWLQLETSCWDILII